jgi:hypothetical protein
MSGKPDKSIGKRAPSRKGNPHELFLIRGMTVTDWRNQNYRM